METVFADAFQWTNPSTWPWMFWLWIVIFCGTWLKKGWDWYSRRQKEEWPVAFGKVELACAVDADTSFRSPFDDRSTTCAGEIEYSYSVGGVLHRGQYKRPFANEEDAAEFTQGLSQLAVTVHYDPNNPSKSMLAESDVEQLLQRRPPASVVLAASNELSGWKRPALLVGALVAAVGLLLSLWVHIGAVMGKIVAPQELFFGLHVGIFAVWFPAVLVAQNMRFGSGSDFWKAALKDLPAGIRYVLYAFAAYAAVNFMGHVPSIVEG